MNHKKKLKLARKLSPKHKFLSEAWKKHKDAVAKKHIMKQSQSHIRALARKTKNEKQTN